MTSRHVIGAAVCLGALLSCAGPSDVPSHRPVVIGFSRAEAATVFPGNYISVVDTAVLTVTQGAAAPATYRLRVGQRDSVARFAVDIENGPVTLDASIRSNNGTLLYSGRLATQVQSGTDSLVVPLAALAPVLLLALDFTVVDFGNNRAFTTRVHNRGSGTLSWDIASVPTGCGCFFQPASGTVAAGQSQSFIISAPFTFTSAPKLTLASPQGRVTIP